ncbi:MAG: hypothetical protein ACRCWR_11945 [Saezia sp.]
MQEFDLTSGINYRLKPNVPVICDIKDQKMITLGIQGDPAIETPRLMPPLYSSAYAIRKTYKEKGSVFKVEKLRGRWMGAALEVSRSQWRGVYGLPIPDDISVLPKITPSKNPDQISLSIETWSYGKVGMILHVGSYADENKTVEQLLNYIALKGFEVVPHSHEEIYLSDPNKTSPDQLKTIIIYRIKK